MQSALFRSTKPCEKCGEDKPQTSYTKRGKVCADCFVRYHTDRYQRLKDTPGFKERAKEHKQRYYSSDKGKANRRAYGRKYYWQNKERLNEKASGYRLLAKLRLLECWVWIRAVSYTHLTLPTTPYV